jgi:CTP:molybdopterin cytidylyltransferase MocA
MDKPVLVVMAAGLGSRYKGIEAVDPVGLNGEIIMDFSIYDAMQAGFEKVVFHNKRRNWKLIFVNQSGYKYPDLWKWNMLFKAG